MSSHQFRVVHQSHTTSVSEIFEAVSPDGGRYLVEVLTTPGVGPWLESWKRDMASLAPLRHPCILGVLDVRAMPDGRPVIVYERPDGPTLARWLAEGRLAPNDVVMDLLSGLAHALSAAHDVGVSHGALTADAVRLDPLPGHLMGFPKLHGFGHRWLRAAARSEATPAGQRLVPASRREIAADIAALAEIADRLLTPVNSSPKLASLLRSAQLLGEEGRFASAVALVEALELVLDPPAEREEITEPDSAVPRSPRALMWRRVIVTAAVIVLAAGAANAWIGGTRPAAKRLAPRAANVSTPPAAAPKATPVEALAPRVVVPPPAAPSPAPLHAAPDAPAPVVKSTSHAPRVHPVWSAREKKIVYVDEAGAPVPDPN
jgi:hypothetical protein